MRKGSSTKIPCTCETCGKSFGTLLCHIRRGQGRFCSHGCRAAASEKRIACVCEHCGNGFWKKPSDPYRFCSRACYHASRATPLIDRFFRYVGRKQENGCIPWVGQRNEKGYGVIGPGPQAVSMLIASRVSYEFFVGPIPAGLCVLHKCDFPPCVAPSHLFLGTRADNAADKVSKGRQTRGERTPWAKLTDSQVLEMRSRHLGNGGAETTVQLAEAFGVTRAAVRQVIIGKSWKHVS